MQNSLPCCPGNIPLSPVSGSEVRWNSVKKKNTKEKKKNLWQKEFVFISCCQASYKKKKISLLWPVTMNTFWSIVSTLTELQKPTYLSLLGSSSPLSIGHCSFTAMDWPRLHGRDFMNPPWYICISSSNFNPSNNDSTLYLDSPAQAIPTLISRTYTNNWGQFSPWIHASNDIVVY